jgi:hypothetical protein
MGLVLGGIGGTRGKYLDAHADILVAGGAGGRVALPRRHCGDVFCVVEFRDEGCGRLGFGSLRGVAIYGGMLGKYEEVVALKAGA